MRPMTAFVMISFAFDSAPVAPDVIQMMPPIMIMTTAMMAPTRTAQRNTAAMYCAIHGTLMLGLPGVIFSGSLENSKLGIGIWSFAWTGRYSMVGALVASGGFGHPDSSSHRTS